MQEKFLKLILVAISDHVTSTDALDLDCKMCEVQPWTRLTKHCRSYHTPTAKGVMAFLNNLCNDSV